jgi:hypothetical protein
MPASEYDTTEECQFSTHECRQGLEGLDDDLLMHIYRTGSVIFRSNEFYYDLCNRNINKYNDLDVYDGSGEFIATVKSDYDPDFDCE